MTKIQKVEFVELLKKFKSDEDFMKLVSLLPVYRNHKLIEKRMRECDRNYDVSEFDLLVFELEDLENIGG